MAHLYRPGHPAVLRAIKFTVEEAEKQNIPVSVCGQTAEDINMIPVLLGLGVNELSMSPASMPLVKSLIRKLAMHECVELVEKALQCDHSHEVIALTQAIIRQRAPELLEI